MAFYLISNIIIALVIVIGINLDKSSSLGLSVSNVSEDATLNFTQLAYKYGHPGEEMEIITEDDYILKLFHIPGNQSRPVLLVHGNTATADCWITRGKISLAITLADLGYDVWAINLRGTRYSRRHRYIDPDVQAKEFFDFSFYELGAYDLPPTIDFILSKTGQSQIIAIGHSVGTTSLYMLGAEKPEYNEKIKLAVSLAPISYISHEQHFGGLATLLPITGPFLLSVLDLLNIYEVFNHDKISPVLQAVCMGPFGYDLCIRHGVSEFFGHDEEGLEPAFAPTYFGHFPGGSSTKTYKHIVQVILNKRFAKYDYGKKKNLKVYNSEEPPLFDLSKVSMDMAVFVGRNDYLSSVADAERLQAALPNVVHFQVMPNDKFNHADFVWGRYMPDDLYPYLFKVIDKYN